MAFFLPLVSLAFILYFGYFDFIFLGKKRRFLINNGPTSRPTQQEYLFTIINLLLYAGVGFLIQKAIDTGLTSVYSVAEFTSWDYIYLVISFFTALGMHDLYFYLSHRLLHIKFIFKSVHAFHHQAHSPNSWSALSFHPLEGIVQIAIIPLIAFILPIHVVVLYLFVGFMMFITIYGHSGYELRANKSPLFAVFNTSLHHYQHHQFVHYNFGIYLNMWDRLFKSNYPAYESSLQQLAEKFRQEGNSAKHPSRGK